MFAYDRCIGVYLLVCAVGYTSLRICFICSYIL